MPAIFASSPVANTTSSLPIGSAQDSGDLLADMNPAMETAFAVGRPTDSSSASAILGTAGAYISGANATIAKLDDGITSREREIQALSVTDPAAAQDKQRDLDLLKRLRERIQLSVERVSETLAGTSDEQVGSADDEREIDERLRRRREELEVLEQRRQLLAPVAVEVPAPTDSTTVAGVYGAAATTTSTTAAFGE